MSNTNMPFGFRPIFMADAQKKSIIFPVTNNYGTALYINDMALAVTAGTVERSAASGAILGPIISLYRNTASAGLRTESLLPVQYMAASPGTGYTYFALVACDPNIMMMAQEDGVVSSLTAANNFGAVDIIYTTAGSTTTGISGATIDSSTIDATATRPLQLVMPAANFYDIDAGAYNAVSAAGAALNYGKWIVRPFNHQFGPGSLAVAFA